MQCKRTSLIVGFVAGLLSLTYSAHAASASETVDNRVQQIALFKNGLGFFISEVVIPDGNDLFSIVPVGSASHGTFWVAYPPQVKLANLVAKSVDSQQMADALTIPELLKANVGRSLKLTYNGKELQGVIEYFPEDRLPIEPGPYLPARPASIRMPHVRSSLILIQTEAGQIAINPHSVSRLEFPGKKAQTCFPAKTKCTQIDVHLRAPAGGKKLTLSYLAKGITWAPSYMVDITDPDKARISAKAAIINEVADLDDVQIQLVTGFPNLQFADTVSPFALKENLAQFLQSLTGGQGQRRRVAAVMSQRAYAEELRGSMIPIMPDYGSAEAGQVAEDLFFYPIEKVSLKKDQVGYYPLFTESVPYEHVYRWDIPDYINEQGQYIYGQQRGQESKPEEDVWHCLKMDNSTKVPWTTAPAEVVQAGLILGQDTLKYTPSKGKALLRITKAMSVKVQQVELENEPRKRGALAVYGRNYDLVYIQGKLSVQNFQPKAIKLEITKTLSGEVTSSEPQAKIEKLARGLSRVNELSQLTWTIDLDPGQEQELVYTYQAYVRR